MSLNNSSDPFAVTPRTSRLRKRKSVVGEYHIFKHSHDEVLLELQSTWDEMGLTDEVQGQRMHQFYGHLTTLLREMATEEAVLLKNLKKKVSKALPAIERLRKELGLDIYNFTTDFSGPLVEAEGVLSSELRELEEEKGRRIEERDKLRDEDIKLCNELEKPAFKLAHQVPSLEILEQLQKHVQDANTEKASRVQRLGHMKKNVEKWARKVEYVPRDDTEALLITRSEREVVVSAFNMDILTDLHAHLEDKYSTHLSLLRVKVNELKEELEIWWDKCFATEQQRHALPQFDEENCTDETFEAYKNEVNRWKKYYESRETVLNTVQAWETLWREKTDFEHKRDNDPNRFNTRGGNLERELKRQRAIDTQLLPRAREEVRVACNEWQNGRSEDAILLDGKPPMQYLDYTMLAHKQQQEREKIDKVKAKKEQLLSETRFGTPKKAKLRGTPSAGALLGRTGSPGSRSIISRVGSPMLRSGTPTRSRVRLAQAPSASTPVLAPMTSPNRRPPLPPRQINVASKPPPPPRPAKRALNEQKIAGPSNQNHLNVGDYHEFQNHLLSSDELVNSTHSTHSVEFNPPKKRC